MLCIAGIDMRVALTIPCSLFPVVVLRLLFLPVDSSTYLDSRVAFIRVGLFTLRVTGSREKDDRGEKVRSTFWAKKVVLQLHLERLPTVFDHILHCGHRSAVVGTAARVLAVQDCDS